jgi:hypothetical protein
VVAQDRETRLLHLRAEVVRVVVQLLKELLAVSLI